MEGPFPHLYSRLCMLLAIIPLSIATIVKEETDKLNGGMVSSIKGELVASLQILVQFSGLLSPPPAAVHLANTAARKAAIVLSNLKSSNDNMYISSKDSSSIKAGWFWQISSHLVSFAHFLPFLNYDFLS